MVHALSRGKDVSVIIKRGGAQGSHGVRTSYGDRFNFSQWGCGAFNGVPTFCSEQLVLSPTALDKEANALRHLGIYDPYMMLSVDPACICATPFHMIASQLEELRRGNDPRGTIGTGVGEAYRMSNALGQDFTIRASELTSRGAVTAKLQRQLEYYREKYADYPEDNGIQSDRNYISENLNLLHDDDFLPFIIDLFVNVGGKIRLAELSKILRLDGTAIVECSHGVLTDAETGLVPHVSAIRTLPKFTHEMLRSAGYAGEIVNLAVHRAYEIRHGAGPMPTYDPEFTMRMLPGSHKDENRWQGIVRAGALDLNLMQYAINNCEETPFDGLCLTWADQILKTNRIWPVCTSYENSPAEGEPYTDFLKHAEPEIIEHKFKKPISGSELFNYIDNILADCPGIPLKMLSVGPTERDKISPAKI